MIDPKQATIWWDGKGNFAVLERPAKGSPEQDWYDWRTEIGPYRRWNDLGANYGDWEGTPTQLFQAFCYILCNTARTSGPATEKTLNALLDQFAKIRGCEWTDAVFPHEVGDRA